MNCKDEMQDGGREGSTGKSPHPLYSQYTEKIYKVSDCMNRNLLIFFHIKIQVLPSLEDCADQ